jgi:hypothetical protein
MKVQNLIAIVIGSYFFVVSAPFIASSQVSANYKRLELKLENRSAFAADETTLYYVSGKKIIALDRQTWKSKWVYESSEKWIPKLELDDSQVYALTWDGSMVAINLSTGRKNWSQKSFQKLSPIGTGFPDPGEGSSLVFMSFFVLSDQILVSQMGQYTVFEKSGRRKLLSKNDFDASLYTFTYLAKPFEQSDHIVKRVFSFSDQHNASPSAGNYHDNLFVVSKKDWKLDYRYDSLHNNSAIGFYNHDQSYMPFEIEKFQDYYLSTSVERPDPYRRDSIPYADVRYYFSLYKFTFNPDQTQNLPRRNFGLFRLDSNYPNRQWCYKSRKNPRTNWCEFTEVPHDFQFLGVMDNRAYFMTDLGTLDGLKNKKRFAYFEMGDLPTNTQFHLENDPSEWSAKVQYTDTRPASLFSNLGFTGDPVGAQATDVYALKRDNRYALVSNDNTIRVFDSGRVVTVKVQTVAKNFLSARDVRLGSGDVIVFDGDSVDIFKEKTR